MKVTAEHFEAALDEVGPSVTEETKERYAEIEKRFDTAAPDMEEDKVGRTFQ